VRKRAKNLTEGNIKKLLFKIAWPMFMGMMGMVIFNLADTYFIGRLGVKQLAAMSFTFPIVMFVNALSQSIGIGTSSLVSRNIIAKSRGHVKQIASRAILLGFIIVFVFVSIGLPSIDHIFGSLGAKDDILPYIKDYMYIWFWGVPFVVFPMIGNNIIRATGDTFFPGMLMVAAAVFNIILDPLLIFGIGPFPEMGIQGAALATVLSRSLGFVIILFILTKREKLLTFRIGELKEIFATWKKILYIAGPTSLGMLITPISLGFITKIIASYGKEAVAAFGVASRVEMFALMVIAALGSVLIIFIGQNISKNKFDRIFEALKYALRFSMGWGVIVFTILFFFGQAIASFFTDDLQVIEVAKTYFLIMGASYGFQGLVMLSTASFNGLNKPIPSAIFSIIRMMVIYVPLAWIGSILFGLNGVFWAGFIANITIGVVAFWFLQRTIYRLKLK
jgi:putative MATE family efflux protein